MTGEHDEKATGTPTERSYKVDFTPGELGDATEKNPLTGALDKIKAATVAGAGGEHGMQVVKNLLGGHFSAPIGSVMKTLTGTVAGLSTGVMKSAAELSAIALKRQNDKLQLLVDEMKTDDPQLYAQIVELSGGDAKAPNADVTRVKAIIARDGDTGNPLAVLDRQGNNNGEVNYGELRRAMYDYVALEHMKRNPARSEYKPSEMNRNPLEEPDEAPRMEGKWEQGESVLEPPLKYVPRRRQSAVPDTP